MRRNKKPGIQQDKKSRGPFRLTPQQTAHLLLILFAGIPMVVAPAIAWWAGWGVDGAIFATMGSGIFGAILLGAVVLGFSR